jgi:hypothetical protein
VDYQGQPAVVAGWSLPTINNGLPYLPDVKNIWLRRFYWFFCRNPLMNFVGFVVGVEDRNYTVTGSVTCPAHYRARL